MIEGLPMKWVIAVTAVVVLIVGLALSGRKSVHTEIFIPARAEQVWQVLTDLGGYSEWNSVLRPKEGQPQIVLNPGEKIIYTFSQDADNAYEITSTVKAVRNQVMLNQGGGIPAVLTFDHFYRLEPVKDGVLVKVDEEYLGIGVHFWNPKPVELAYQRLAQELKTRVLDVHP